MQTDGRLIQHIQHAGQVRADLGGQPDALGFPARQCAGQPVQSQILETHILEELQAAADFLEHHVGDLRLGFRQFQMFDPVQGLNHGHLGEFMDILIPDPDAEGLLIEPPAAALRAGTFKHEGMVPFLGHRAGCFDIPSFNQRLDALDIVIARVLVAAGRRDRVGNRPVASVQDGMHLGLGEILDRLVEIHLVGLAQCRKGLPLDILGIDDVLVVADAALPDGLARIRDQGIQIHFLGNAKTMADIAGTQRRVEREQPRFQFRHREAADPARVVA